MAGRTVDSTSIRKQVREHFMAALHEYSKDNSKALSQYIKPLIAYDETNRTRVTIIPNTKRKNILIGIQPDSLLAYLNLTKPFSDSNYKVHKDIFNNARYSDDREIRDWYSPDMRNGDNRFLSEMDIDNDIHSNFAQSTVETVKHFTNQMPEVPFEGSRIKTKFHRANEGNELDVIELRQGNIDTCWLTRRKLSDNRKGKGKSIHLVYDLTASSGVSATELIWQGVAMSRAVQQLENKGVAVSVTHVCPLRGNILSPIQQRNARDYYHRINSVKIVPIKSKYERLNHVDMSIATMPYFFRHFGFYADAPYMPLCLHYSSCMGYPVNLRKLLKGKDSGNYGSFVDKRYTQFISEQLEQIAPETNMVVVPGIRNQLDAERWCKSILKKTIKDISKSSL